MNQSQPSKIRLFRILTLLLTLVLVVGCTKGARKARLLERAESDFRSGAYDKAKIEYLNVLRLEPHTAIALSRMGQMWLEDGVPLQAGPFLNKAREVTPEDVANRVRLAQAYDAVGKRTEARSELASILRQAPGNGEAVVLLARTAFTPDELKTVEQALVTYPDKKSTSYHLAKATLALRKSDLSAAKNAVAEALSLCPESPDAHELKGLINLAEKNPQEAGKEFETAAGFAAPRSPIKIANAEFLARTGKRNEAISELQSLTKRTPDFLLAWNLLALLAFTEKKHGETLKLLENVTLRDPNNVEARLLEAETRLAGRETQKAIEILTVLERLHPDAPAIKLLLARSYLQDNQVPKAEILLREAIRLKPGFTDAILFLAEINLRNGKGTEAISSLEKVLDRQPDLDKAQALLAGAYQQAGRFKDAEDILRQKIQTTPQRGESYLALGLIQRQENKQAEARESFKKALELSPGNAEATNQLVAMDLEVKDFAAATRRVQEQLAARPDDAICHLLEGKVEAAQKEWPKAEVALKKAISLGPHLTSAYDLLIAVYIASGRLKEAEQEVETILSKSPQNEQALMTLGSLKSEQKDYSGAANAYDKVLALAPGSLSALNNLAYLSAEYLNQPAKALDLAHKARKLAPNNPAVADTLGFAFFKKGDYAQALTLFQEAAEKLPTNPEIQIHLGLSHYMMGNEEDARKAFQQGLNMPGDAPGRAEAQRRLNVLDGKTTLSPSENTDQLEQILKQYPNDVVTRLRLAETYESRGDFGGAARTYEKALESNPMLVSPLLKLARLYTGPLHNNQRALELAKKARDLAPTDPSAAALLGKIALDAGNAAWAYSLLRESVRQLPGHSSTLRDFAWSAYRLGKVHEAETTMQDLLQTNPQAPEANEARTFLTFLKFESNRAAVAAAEPEVNRTLAEDPKYIPARLARAAIEAERNQPKAAIDTLNRILNDVPDFPLAQRDLAALYLRSGEQDDRAFDLATKARRSLPDDLTLAETLAEVSYRKREYDRAIQLLHEDGLEKRLTARALFFLGMSQLRTERRTDGRATLQLAFAEGLREPLATEAREALEEGALNAAKRR